MEPEGGRKPYPQVAALVARLASLHGLSSVLDVGLVWTRDAAVTYPQLDVTCAGQRGTASFPSGFPFRRHIDLGNAQGLAALSDIDTSRTALVVTGPSDWLPDLEAALVLLDRTIRSARLAIFATTNPEPVLAYLRRAGLDPAFAGFTRAADDDDRSASLFILDASVARTDEPPAGFKVVAIMTAYNEEDIVAASIAKLVANGIGVYLIDNWSTDGTFAAAEEFRGRGLIGLEHFPDEPTGRFELRSLLTRVATIASQLGADWYIHHDVDERRNGPWPDLGLREALWRVDQSGFNAVDHTVLNFRPIDDGFPSGGDFEAYFRHFEFGRTSDLHLQVKAWKNQAPVDLAGRAGHEARFRGRRIFPYKFELKHYPIRSQAHGERKIFRDRVPRWDPRERRLAWHVQYDDVAPHQSFIRVAADLIEDHGPATRARFMPELLAGAGLSESSIPRYALSGFAGRKTYVWANRITGSRGYRALSWLLGLPMRVARKLLRGVRARGPVQARG